MQGLGGPKEHPRLPANQLGDTIREGEAAERMRSIYAEAGSLLDIDVDVDVDVEPIMEHNGVPAIESVIDILTTNHVAGVVRAGATGKGPAESGGPLRGEPANGSMFPSEAQLALSKVLPESVHVGGVGSAPAPPHPPSGDSQIATSPSDSVPDPVSEPTTQAKAKGDTTTRRNLRSMVRGSWQSGATGARAAWLVALMAPPHLRGSIFVLQVGSRARFTIGGDAGCDIVLSSPAISREHAEIGFDRERGKFYVADLRSTNGTYLQLPGEQGFTQLSKPMDLVDNSLLRVGPEQIRFVFRCH